MGVIFSLCFLSDIWETVRARFSIKSAAKFTSAQQLLHIPTTGTVAAQKGRHNPLTHDYGLGLCNHIPIARSDCPQSPGIQIIHISRIYALVLDSKSTLDFGRSLPR